MAFEGSVNADSGEADEAIPPAPARPTDGGQRLFRHRFFAAAVLLALADAGRLAAQAAQVIELGAPDLAAADHLDRVDHRRIKRKDALDAFPIGDLADREVLVQPAAGAADAHALIGLHARALALDHLDVDDDRVPRAEIGDFLAGGKLRHLLFFELLNHIHGISPSAAPDFRASRRACRACFYAKLSALSPLRGA